jgi:hypothetical protein
VLGWPAFCFLVSALSLLFSARADRDLRHVAEAAKLPSEAWVIDGSDSLFFTHGRTEARFTLPNSRTPGEWLHLLAGRHASNPDAYRRSATEYGDWNGKAGFRVRYRGRERSGRQLFDVVFGWG